MPFKIVSIARSSSSLALEFTAVAAITISSKRIMYSARSSSTGSRYGEPGDKTTVGGTIRSGMKDETFSPSAVNARAYSALDAVISFTGI